MRHPIRDVETQAFNTAMQNELQRRLDTIQSAPPDPLGTFSRIDLVLAAACAVALPWWVWGWLT